MMGLVRRNRRDRCSAQAHAGTDPRVPAARRRARRTAPARTALAPARGVGRPAGQHAPGRGAVDPRARRGDRTVDLGGPLARPALGTALPRVRRRRARPRGLLAREAAGGWQDAADGRGPGRSPPRLPRRAPDAVRRGRAGDRRPRQRPPLRRVDRHGRDQVGGSAAAHRLDGAAAGDRRVRRAPRARASVPARLRSRHARRRSPSGRGSPCEQPPRRSTRSR